MPDAMTPLRIGYGWQTPPSHAPPMQSWEQRPQFFGSDSGSSVQAFSSLGASGVRASRGATSTARSGPASRAPIPASGTPPTLIAESDGQPMNAPAKATASGSKNQRAVVTIHRKSSSILVYFATRKTLPNSPEFEK